MVAAATQSRVSTIVFSGTWGHNSRMFRLVSRMHPCDAIVPITHG